MRKFRDGDRVKIIDVPEDAKHHLGKTGIAKQPQGYGYEGDDAIVWFDGGGR